MRGATLSHARAAAGMLLVTLLWSTAGVVARHLQQAERFEVTFWRSSFNALALVALLCWMRGGPALWASLRRAPRVVLASGLCWSVMFTAFMVALTMTAVANVLVTMSIGPLLTALFARLFLHQRLPARTWTAIAAAGAGIAWMFASGVQAADARSVAGMLTALAVPVAAAFNWTLLHRASGSHGADGGAADDAPADMLPAVLIGAVLSALLALPLAWPLHATAHDLGLLAGLGVFQLAVPCLLVVRLTRELPPAEISLLGLLEVIFGVLWAWLGAGEAPPATALSGGAIVITALVANELLSLRARTPGAAAAHPIT